MTEKQTHPPLRMRSVFVKIFVTMGVTTILIVMFIISFFTMFMFNRTPAEVEPVHRVFFYLLLALVVIVLIIAHIFIRDLLKPLKELRLGVNRVSEGNLEVEVPVLGKDELAGLSEAFNTMAKRIRGMIKARDQLLLDVSHELRSPITRMKVALEFLPENEKKNSIRADLAEMETMITELLESERLKNGRLELQACDIITLIKDVAGIMEGRPPGIKLNPMPANLPLTIDEKRIKAVLQNVLENAIKYSTPGSKPVNISYNHDGETATIAITDDGRGIPADELPQIFEPFYRVDRSRSKETGGYGLGLSMCKRIMEAHNGSIKAENNSSGRGVTVTLSF